ncbi:unnamed protein product [Parascedosporium putredinis]|uniref:Uncharacterized protein n=1 Tax=Parascedosporium putredinis TaxID=1442378 RepID=A0A9P1H4B7_9PEZI|nr:unnamed protein product [Parascedosporium putredinis]CAI7996484.1 unnamed protein product [Parascedosporium putredinis]
MNSSNVRYLLMRAGPAIQDHSSNSSNSSSSSINISISNDSNDNNDSSSSIISISHINLHHILLLWNLTAAYPGISVPSH